MTMDRDEVFAAWAPDLAEDEFGPPWTNWAKPVLFAAMTAPAAASPPGQADALVGVLDAILARKTRCAAVIDLPGVRAIRLGIAFAERGFRPVPLFNGCPGPGELVDTASLMSAIWKSAPRLGELTFDREAPPAFLLDANRMRLDAAREPGRFDNRWFTFPQDFPSANLLLARRIESVLLVQENLPQPREDLAHVLKRWQEAGMRIELVTPDKPQPEAIDVRRPARFRSLWYHLCATLGLFPNSAGGFGGVIPRPSSG